MKEREETHRLLKLDVFQGDVTERLTEAQASEYADRVILHGERAAMQWVSEVLHPPAAPVLKSR